MWFQGLAAQHAGLRSRSAKQSKSKKPARREGRLEALEDRYLLTGDMQMNLVSDQAGAALIQDPNLIAPWGITIAPDGNFWVADSGSSVATIYSGDANTSQPFAKDSLTVELPGGLPTGIVSNSSQVIFDSANGNLGPTSVSSTLAQLEDQVDGAVYTGLAIGTVGGTTYLFAADFQNGTIDVFDTSFNYLTSLAANAHPGYSPFGVQVINGQLDVTYAQYSVSGQSAGDNDSDDSGEDNGPQNDAKGGNGKGNGNGPPGPGNGPPGPGNGPPGPGNGPSGPGNDNGPGHHGPKGNNGDNDDDDNENGGAGVSGVRLLVTTGGFVDSYALSDIDVGGNALPTAAWSSGTGLNAPWGLALAPNTTSTAFGNFSGDLLVGDFGDGHITALNPSTGAIATTATDASGELLNPSGTPIVIDHLLGLTFGNGNSAGGANTLYFTSAPVSGALSTAASSAALLVLDPSGPGTITSSGNANVAVSGGGTIVDDSSSSSAITANGNAQVAAGTIDVVGSVRANGNANIDGLIDVGAAPVGDPLASLAEPSMVGLPRFHQGPIPPNSHVVLEPGVYNGGINVQGHTSVFLEPGIYILNGGGLQVGGQATVVGNDVMIFNDPMGPADRIHVSGQGSLVLSGPDSGPYKGIAIFQDRVAGSPIAVDGQGLIKVQGILYAPTAPIQVSGNGELIVLNDLDDSVPAQLIAFQVNATGNATVEVSGIGAASVISGIHGLLGSLQPATAANPLAITGGAISATEGATFTGAVAAIASAISGAIPSDFTATINWGDGTSSAATLTPTANGGFLVDGSHVFHEEGAETIAVTVSDNASPSSTVSSTATVQVADAPLVPAAINIPVQQSLTIGDLQIAAVTDTGGGEAMDNYTATIDWGDGSTSPGVISVNGNTVSVLGSHTYAVAGRFDVDVTVNDAGGASTVVHSIVIVGSPPPTNLFVGSAFQDVLNRPADMGALSFLSNALQNGLPRYTFASDLTHSDEYLDDQINQAYLEFLGRDADSAGLVYWLNLMKGGMTIEQLDADFIGSPEFFAFAGDTDDLFVEHMYFDVLGRAADTAGLT
ncbi:MAG: TIGR03118 family protein, partial [Pirellulales bacterium]